MLVPPRRNPLGIILLWRGSALAQVGPILLVVMAIAFLLHLANTLWGMSWIDLTPTPFTLVGLPLSIFLGFRNNACYDRWWEARKLWGRLINTSRSLARQTQTLIAGEDPEVAVLQRESVYHLMAFAHAMRLHLREQPYWEQLGPFVDDVEMQAIRHARNKPQAVIDGLAKRYRKAMDRGWLNPWHLSVLDAQLTDLTDVQGACERIKNTPVPVTYTELTHHIVALYVLFLPFGLFHTLGWLTPIVVVFIAYCFLGLDAVGSQIENPFEEDPNDLPLAQIARMLENDLRHRLGETELPPDLRAVHGVLL